MSSEDLPFSLDFLKGQCGGSKVVVDMVLDEFLNQVPHDTAEMERGMASGNLVAVGKAAHRLKGTAGTIGASKLHPLCAAVEQACKNGNAEEAATLYVQLKEEALRCIDAVPSAKLQIS